jgi:tetratricopeptide (TPR) repeat protein
LVWLNYYSQIEDHERALDHATRYVELKPGLIHAHDSLLSIRRLAEGEAALAEDCDRLAALELDTPSDFAYRGDVMRDKCKREEQALEDYSGAIELAPDWADPYARRSHLHKIDGRFDEALADMNRAVELAPNWVNVYFWRGQLYAGMEMFEEALADYERDIELGVDGSNLRLHQARALDRLGRDEEALRILEEFLAINPKMSAAHRNVATQQFSMGRVDDALATLDRALEINPEHSDIIGFRAFYSAFGSDPCRDIARRLEKYEERGSTAPVVWSNIAYIHGFALVHSCPEIHDPAKALKLAEKAVGYDSTNSSWQQSLGISLYRSARYEEAGEALQRSIDLKTSQISVDDTKLFALALVHWQLGEQQKARDFYRRGLERMEQTFNQRRPESVLIRREAAELLGIEE